MPSEKKGPAPPALPALLPFCLSFSAAGLARLAGRVHDLLRRGVRHGRGRDDGRGGDDLLDNRLDGNGLNNLHGLEHLGRWERPASGGDGAP